MCLILFSFEPDSPEPLIVLANRDEFHARPTAQAFPWDNERDMVAGQDLKSGGTWLGVSSKGRFAAVTNYRQLSDMQPGELSRGELPVSFLMSDTPAMEYLELVASAEDAYSGFNLLVYDGNELGYWSNRSGQAPSNVSPGIHGLSNALLDTSWPKVETGKQAVQELLEAGRDADMDWMRVLSDRTQASDDALPNTGVGLEKERMLSPRCIVSPDYGTRCSSWVRIHASGRVEFEERTWIPADLPNPHVRFEANAG